MGQLLGKESPPELQEYAHSLKVDPVALDVIRETILLSGRSVTLFPSRGVMHPNRLVYAGDLSCDTKETASQIRPLLVLEYLVGRNAAVVKQGITGDVIMVLVREACEVGWDQGSRPSSCACGGETEARLYSNGCPVAVNVSEDFLDVAPLPADSDWGPQSPPASGGAAGPSPYPSPATYACLGSSMVELVKHTEDRGIQLLSKRSRDGYPTRRVAAFSQVSGQHVAVFKMLDCSFSDPLATLVMAWWTSFDNS